MASRPSAAASTGTATAKRTRNRKPSHYVVRVRGEDNPTLVIAKTLKDALAAVVTVKVAEDTDLIAAGKNNWAILDTTAPAQTRLDDAAREAA
jgi:sarcosine oxidase gamma subunit